MAALHENLAHWLLPRLQPPGTSEAELLLVPGQLAVGFVIDTPAGWQELDRSALERLDESPPELLAAAVVNLHRLSAPQSWIDVITVPGVRIYHAADGLAASRLLILDRLLERMPPEGVIVAVPSPDQLLAVVLEGPGALEALTVMLAATGLANETTDSPLSDQAYWFDGSWLQPLEVRHTEEGVEVVLPEALQDALQRLSSMLYGVVAEA